MINYNRSKNIIEDVIKFAERKHSDQKYGSYPYINHLNDVARNTELLLTKNEMHLFNHTLFDALVLAYLHDILEDTDCKMDELINLGVNDSILIALDLITKKSNIKYNEYIENVMSNELSHVVKIADTMSNLAKSLNDLNMKRIRKYNKQLSILLIRGI